MKTTYWFKKKEESFGWTPISWQGWATLLLWGCALFFGLGAIEENPLFTLMVLLIATAILLIVCDTTSTPEKQTAKHTIVKKISPKKVATAAKKSIKTSTVKATSKKTPPSKTTKKVEKKKVKK